jgi:hypothetical protein
MALVTFFTIFFILLFLSFNDLLTSRQWVVFINVCYPFCGCKGMGFFEQSQEKKRKDAK